MHYKNNNLNNLFLGELAPENNPLVLIDSETNRSFQYAGELAFGWGVYLQPNEDSTKANTLTSINRQIKTFLSRILNIENENRIDNEVSEKLTTYFGEISGLLIFLLGAMTIVELIDLHKGFTVITHRIRTKSVLKLLWIVGLITFILSSLLDNLATAIIMITLLKKLMPKGEIRMMSHILDMSVFPGNQGGPLMHIIAAKAVAFGECLTDEFFRYAMQVKSNAQAMAQAFNKRGYKLISGGTDNHMMLIDLRNKNISGKDAENALVKAEITVNKNMVPFDDKSPFITSGIRVGTPAITTRGLVEEDMETVVALIDKVLMNHTDEAVLEQVAEEVNELMSERAMFVF